MPRIMNKLDKIPILNIFGTLLDWSNGDEYVIDDDVQLTPELAESDRKTDESYNEHFKAPANKGNSGKGKSQFKVSKEQLNTERATELPRVIEKGEEGRDERN